MTRTLTAMALALLLTPTLAPAPVVAKPAAHKTAGKKPAPDTLAPTARWSANARGHAPTPPMGWNSWNAFGSGVTEARVMASVEIIRANGLDAKGYRYIDIDEGWWQKRRESDGRMLVRTAAFPSAATADGNTSLRPFTDRLHAMGLKAGIYSDIGRNGCIQSFGGANDEGLPTGNVAEREVGLYGHTDQDIRLYFQEWNFDLIKVDGCGIRALGPDRPRVKAGLYRAFDPIINFDSLPRTNITEVKRLFGAVSDALAKYRPDNDYLFSICLWGSSNVRAWAKDMGNISRTSEDIGPSWGRMLYNLDTAIRRPLYAHPGSWNDPDMLYIGKGDFDDAHMTEARSHMTLWSMVNAPLFIGMDLSKASPEQVAIFGNANLIALNQDKAGNQAVLAFDTDDVQVLVKTLADGDKAVAVFNRTNGATKASITAAHLKFAAHTLIATTNLWDNAKGSFTDELKLDLAPHETQVFRVHGQRALANGAYLSETPGIVNPAQDGVPFPQADPLFHRGLQPWDGTKGTGEHPRYGGWGGAMADATPYGQQLAVAGNKFETGIGILAGSRLEVRNEGATRFTAQVGVDDTGAGHSGAVTFLVYGDGRLLAQSRPMAGGQPVADLSADITGAKIVELVARPAATSLAPDPVVWANAALMK